jgi:hypothetical protein
MEQRDFIGYFLSITVARGLPSIKLKHTDVMHGIEPGINPHYWDGLPKLMGPVDERRYHAMSEFAVDVIKQLRRKKILIIEREDGPDSQRQTVMVNMMWTPELENAKQD